MKGRREAKRRDLPAWEAPRRGKHLSGGVETLYFITKYLSSYDTRAFSKIREF